MAKGFSAYLQADVIAAMQLRNKNDEQVGPLASREIMRLYNLYADALRDVKLSVPEACLICDMLNSSVMDERSARMLWAAADDAIRLEYLDKKWEIDGPALVAKLRNLSTIQCMALVDASDRFWSLPDEARSDMFNAVRDCFGIKPE